MRLLLTLTIFGALHGTAAAQEAPRSDTACTYDSCALRIHRGFWGAMLVRGIAAEKVARLGLLPGPAALFAERSDTAARFYGSFRSKQRTSLVALVLGFGALTVGVAAASKDNEGLAIPMFVAGGTLAILGAEIGRSGQNDLQRAVWWYNRTLLPAAAVPPAHER